MDTRMPARSDLSGHQVELSAADVRAFQANGHLLLKDALGGATAPLFDEVRAELAQAYGDTEVAPESDDGVPGYFLPAMTRRTPTSLELVESLAPVAAALLGAESVVPVYADVTVFFGSTPWHSDIGMAVPFVKFGTYADELNAGNGALRFVSGSHREPEYSRLKSAVHDLEVVRGMSIEDTAAALPHVVADSAPGDVVAIDGKIWHMTTGGGRRLQWSLPFIDATDEERARRFFDSFVIDASIRGYDGTRFPFYGEDFLETPLGTTLRRIGAVDVTRAREAA